MSTSSPPVNGEALRQLREAAGLSQDDLAYQVRVLLPGQMKVTGRSIGLYERGQIGQSRPNIILLAAFSDVLGCSLEDLAPGLLTDKQQVIDLLTRISYFAHDPQVSGAVA